MKHAILILFLAATLTSAGAQTPAPSPSSATHATSAAKLVAKATAPKPAVPAAKPGLPANPNVARYIKAPANIPVHKGIQKPVFTVALRYLEIKVGTGAAAEPGKLLKVHYTGYRAADGVKFDSSYDHPGPPIRDKDGKPVLGPDGKPKMGEPQSFPFHQGVGGTIPGFDQGFGGMKAGGKRRIFIPWQLAYGTRAIPDRGADHPGIPAMSDLIFDVELLDVADAPPPMQPRPPMGMMPGGRPNMQRPGAPGAPSAPGATGIGPAQGVAPKVAAPGTPPSPSVPGTSLSPGIPGNPSTPPPPSAQPTPVPQPKAPPAPSTPPASNTPPPATPPQPQ
jgi:peptidylprolyl isomerase